MHGIHLIADLHDCRCPPGFLLDGPGLEVFCVEACTRHGLTVVGRLFHPFRDAHGEAAGVTGTVVLAESHLALHTWPEIGAVTLDVYVCNFSGDNSESAHALFRDVIAAFAPARTERIEVKRGQLGIREQIIDPAPPDPA
ncbi:S-adenosylmethionine decarboxylase proenzyme [Dechloromonas denitrificans]|uniref:S-adenosylmethionine decarboxylase proenzyme n=1 Tax=Dechloromonas denitrificans TaxID=281362 RepID=A0A133XEP7_9RHOO|nr:S-adenosylmethionine decarboxylase [Dechloromonas denitrificans]KXB29418.1 S-adenosylmethionine decarboxylase proenzyme [Dechloromonas denitrificans]